MNNHMKGRNNYYSEDFNEDDYSFEDEDRFRSMEKIKLYIVAFVVLIVVVSSVLIGVIMTKNGKNPFGKPNTIASTGDDSSENMVDFESDEYEESEENNNSDTYTDNQDENSDSLSEDNVYQETYSYDDDTEYSSEDNKKDDESYNLSYEEACMVVLSRNITDEDIINIKESAPDNLPEEPIQMAINYLYAWNGYHFHTDAIYEYFLETTWYVDEGRTIEECEARMNDIEKANLDKLVALIKK